MATFGSTAMVNTPTNEKRPVDDDSHDSARKKARVEEEKRVDDKIDYTKKTNRTDLTLKCQDGDLYYSKYQIARYSRVLGAAIDLSSDSNLPINDYTSSYVKCALKFMDQGSFFDSVFSSPTTAAAHILYKMAHQWEYDAMEKQTLKYILADPDWGILEDLRVRHNPSYSDAVKTFLAKGKRIPDGVISDVILEHRVVTDGYLAQMVHFREVKAKLLKSDTVKYSSELKTLISSMKC
jgi:hypothetical protein